MTDECEMNEATAHEVGAALLEWYDAQGCALPWRRRDGGRPDPYVVWLSEIMLQQTTVATVERRFAAFIERWPGVRELAAADEEEVLAAWAGLGYYARARNLHACARRIVEEHDGRFPQTMAELKRLPGIGDYTAAAIAAIAFGQPVAAVDGNVERVVARLFAVTRPLPGARATIRHCAQALVPEDRPGDFAQAMMDLGRLVCRPRTPRCDACPLASCCQARVKGCADELPRRTVRKDRPVRTGTVFVIQREDGALLFRRRPRKGLLGGLWELPSQGWDGGPPLWPDAAPFGLPTVALNTSVRHVFTHFELHVVIRQAMRPLEEPLGSAVADGKTYCWCQPREAEKVLALPTLVSKVLKTWSRTKDESMFSTRGG